MVRMRDGSNVKDPRLGRLIEFDEKSRQYPILRRLTASQQESPRSAVWEVGVYLDQGQEGACVGFGYSAELAAQPIQQPGITNEFARQNYWDIQREDPWPGGSYEGADPKYDGTSVLSGAKHFTDRGYYSAYHWAFSEEELCLAVGWKGPAVIGVNWYSGMFDANAHGFITVTGSLSGGHCTLIKGVNVEEGYYIIHNSWGPSWGYQGTAMITREDMATLLKQDGEVCIPETRVLVAPPNVEVVTPEPAVDPLPPLTPQPEPAEPGGDQPFQPSA